MYIVMMKNNNALSNLKEDGAYILLIKDQIDEIDKMIKYHKNNPHFDIKKALVRYHLQQLIDNTRYIKFTPPLYKLLEKQMC